MHNNEIQDLTRRNAKPVEYLNKQDNLTNDHVTNTWEEYFDRMFNEPLEHPTHVTVLVRRHLPADSPINKYHTDLQIPFLFGMDDDFGRRWLGYLYDTTAEDGWRFILLLPDPYVYLDYLAGKTDLMHVYDSVSDGNFYLTQPDMSNHLISINRDAIPKTATPAEHSMYDNNIWLDKSDLTSGMNVEDVYGVQELASKHKFYPEDKRYIEGNQETNMPELDDNPQPAQPLNGTLVNPQEHDYHDIDNDLF